MNKQINNAKLIIDEDTSFVVELIDANSNETGTFDVTIRDYTTGEETTIETDMDGYVITPSNVQQVEVMDSAFLPDTVDQFKD